ncbi:STAS domain-containing protein [Paractinoplanes brasiliensis]|uniref:Anti-anti-sigma factor n=1 Tax=Paractinoplanes brasiliensis TaxID=52695 RepID=A0A4R6JCA0_9ACTN|nr:STAS domain-containing protein [Actinoplanes brasiliensis]TDO33182.1 anti-anti-sigma factor [Actinoplanes brasiliensis]GID33241.1 hypothetical protein Abr02nite_82240 [Actinoplanes brasiliensis]
MAVFEVKTRTEPDRITVACAGDCDLDARDQLTAVLLDAVSGATTVFVDLSAVDFLDSSGVHALVTAHRAAQARGGHLYAVNAAGSTAVILELTGLDVLLRAPVTHPPRERPHA